MKYNVHPLFIYNKLSNILKVEKYLYTTLNLILSNCHCAVRQGQQKNMFMADQPLIRRLQFFFYSLDWDHIFNQTLASKPLSLKMVQLFFEKFTLVRQGHLWLTN